MPTFHAIAAMSENRVIGDKGRIPWHLPADYRWFKRKTMGGTLIMGRVTFESIGEPLPGRETVVLSRSGMILGVITCHDTQKLDETLSTLPQPYWICGGTQIYAQFLERCECLYLTRVKRTVPGDAFFPSFEDTFTLNLTIHENELFRVERWTNNHVTQLSESSTAPEPWPFEQPSPG